MDQDGNFQGDVQLVDLDDPRHGKARCLEPGCRWASPEVVMVSQALVDLHDHHYAAHDDKAARAVRIAAHEAAARRIALSAGTSVDHPKPEDFGLAPTS